MHAKIKILYHVILPINIPFCSFTENGTQNATKVWGTTWTASGGCGGAGGTANGSGDAAAAREAGSPQPQPDVRCPRRHWKRGDGRPRQRAPSLDRVRQLLVLVHKLPTHADRSREGVLQDAATELYQQPHSVRDARIGRRCAGGGRPADAIEKEETGDPDNEHHHSTESVNSWCSCTNCRHKIMPSDQHRVTRWRESSG